jgi:hypothetical protein
MDAGIDDDDDNNNNTKRRRHNKQKQIVNLSSNSYCKKLCHILEEYFQFFVAIVFALIFLYYITHLFKYNSYFFHTTILYQHDNNYINVHERAVTHSDIIGPKILNLHDGTICITSNYPSKPFLAIVNLTKSFHTKHKHNQYLIKKTDIRYSNIRISGGNFGRIPIQTAVFKNKIILVLLRNGLLIAYTKNSLKLLWNVVVYGRDTTKSPQANAQDDENYERSNIDTDLGGNNDYAASNNKPKMKTMPLRPSNTALYTDDKYLYVLLNNEVVNKMSLKNGKIIWTYHMDVNSNVPGSADAIDDDDEEAVYPVTQYKLGNDDNYNLNKGKKQTRKNTMKPWYSFRNSILTSLPHSPHHLPSFQLKHFKLDSHNVHQRHQHELPASGKIGDDGNSPTTNALCLYNKRGIFVFHKDTGNAITEIVLPEPRHGTNDGSRGIYMASPLKSNTIYHVEGLAGEREEPIPVPECYARVTEGIPPVNAQWNTNICMGHEDVKTTYIATPILVDYFPNNNAESGAPSSITVVVYFTSGGTITLINTLNGNVLSQTRTKAVWSGQAGGKTLHHLNGIDIDEITNSGLKYVYPHCFIVAAFDARNSNGDNGMIGCIGESHLVVINKAGEVVNSIFLIDPPLNEVTVVTLPNEIIPKDHSANNDYMIITSTTDGIIGYHLQNVVKTHESSSIIIGLTVFILMCGFVIYCVFMIEEDAYY